MKTRIALATTLAGCFNWPAPPPERPAPEIRKLADGKVMSLDVNLKDQPGLCPGQEGKLYAKGMVLWPGQKPVSRNIGNDVDSFPPAAFDVRGPLLGGDPQAHLHPSDDILASIETGFEAQIVYTTEPQRFAWRKIIRPEYSCFSTYSVAGQEGESGQGGNSGNSGDVGQSGGPGDPGTPGGRGRDAGRISAYVTVVATAFYPKLYAVIANNTFFLVPADRELWFVASGGPGGPGGNGGDGGAGGEQPTEDKQVYEDGNEVTKRFGTGAAGNGGNGGNGAPGGSGGNGGTIEVTYDAKFPELREWIKTDVRPGAGGAGGAGGNGGNGGGTSADQGAQEGNPGNPGNPAEGGYDGRPGRATVRPGNVSSRFNVRGIALYGTPAALSITTKADQPPMIDADQGKRPPRNVPPPPTRKRPRGGR